MTDPARSLPLSAEEERALRGRMNADETNVGWGEAGRLLATLDAARASTPDNWPAELEDRLADAIRDSGVWTAVPLYTGPLPPYRASAAEIAKALRTTPHVHSWEPNTTLDGWRCEDETCGAQPARASTPDTLATVVAALTSEDEIAHGEAWSETRGGLGSCAYCASCEWPCRTQQSIDRLLALLAAPPDCGDGGCAARASTPLRLTVEPDGAISRVAGGPLEAPIDTAPTDLQEDMARNADYRAGYRAARASTPDPLAKHDTHAPSASISRPRLANDATPDTLREAADAVVDAWYHHFGEPGVMRHAVSDLADAARASTPDPINFEAMRMERGWPTPMHMRRTADALDQLTRPAKYGDVLRWMADACDAALRHTPATDEEVPHG